MRERLQTHGRGVLLSLVGVAAIGWLAATGRLGLYIHPRYFVFTIVMVGIAGIVAIAAFALLPGSTSIDDEHGHEHGRPARARRTTRIATAVLIVATAIALLLVPPTTLTTATVEQRAMNAAAADSADAGPELAGADTDAFTVKDWAVLLRQNPDTAFLAAASPTLVGFVTPDADDPDNVFYVARFIVTCCAVDAQPVGVPVYSPGWRAEHPVDSWVEVSGTFIDAPSGASTHIVLLEPTSVSPATQPADPYVY